MISWLPSGVASTSREFRKQAGILDMAKLAAAWFKTVTNAAPADDMRAFEFLIFVTLVALVALCLAAAPLVGEFGTPAAAPRLEFVDESGV